MKCVAFLLLLFLPSQETLATDKKHEISLMFAGTRVKDVLTVLEKISDRKIVSEPGVVETKVGVRLKATNVSKSVAIMMIVAALRNQADIEVVSEGENYRARRVAVQDPSHAPVPTFSSGHQTGQGPDRPRQPLRESAAVGRP